MSGNAIMVRRRATEVAARVRHSAQMRVVAEQPSSERIVFVQASKAGPRVTHDTALTVSGFWAGVRAITDPISYLSWHVFERQGDGKRKREDLWIDWMLNSQPNPELSARVFRETILAHALTWGNGYAEIERSGSGQPMALWLLPPDRTCVERDAAGNLFYVVYPSGEPPVPIPARDIFHVKGLGFDGIIGYSVVRLAAQSLGLSMALEQNAAAFFGNSSRPAGVLEMPGQLTEPARDQTRREWEKVHQGSARSYRIAVLDQGMKFNPITMPNNEAQMLESRKLSVTEMARWLKVPPHKLADLEFATFSNIEEQNIAFVIESLMYWINGFEEEADLKLFGNASQGRLFTKMNIKALLRGNTAAQQAFITAMLDRGVFDINESREYLDMDPLPGKAGKKRFVPMNMQLLEKAGEEPEPTPPAITDQGVDPEATNEDAEGQEVEEEPPAPAPKKKMTKRKKVTKRARRGK